MKKPRHPQKHVTNVTKKWGKLETWSSWSASASAHHSSARDVTYKVNPLCTLHACSEEGVALGWMSKQRPATPMYKPQVVPPSTWGISSFFGQSVTTWSVARLPRGSLGHHSLSRAPSGLYFRSATNGWPKYSKCFPPCESKKAAESFKRTFYKPCPTWISMVNM